MADLKYYDVILKPVVTEKSMTAMGEKKYTFYVNPDATKTQVKEAVERMFEGAKVATLGKLLADLTTTSSFSFVTIKAFSTLRLSKTAMGKEIHILRKSRCN